MVVEHSMSGEQDSYTGMTVRLDNGYKVHWKRLARLPLKVELIAYLNYYLGK
ncbi:MAG: hypothetical protein R3E08_02045 [Thiotrichaceae bacterium]